MLISSFAFFKTSSEIKKEMQEVVDFYVMKIPPKSKSWKNLLYGLLGKQL
jgi:hypothetical protein